MKYYILLFFLLITTALMAAPDEDLREAAKALDLDGIKKSLAQGADINAVDTKHDNYTALMYVCSYNESDYTTWEKLSGINLKYKKKYEIIQYLILNKADVNLTDKNGQTALSLLFYYDKNIENLNQNQLEIFRLFKNNKADIGKPDNKGNTPLDYLAESFSDYKTKNKMRTFIDMNKDPSYISSPIRIFSPDKTEVGDQLFEGNLNCSLHWFNLPNDRLNWPVSGFTTLDAKIILRMYDEYSSPVKTPSFMPRGYYYIWSNPLNDLINDSTGEIVQSLYLSVMLSHHSNGQSGNFYTGDGRVNTDSGNFSTNFFEFALNTILLNDIWMQVAYQWHPGFNRESCLEDQYETQKGIFGMRKVFELSSNVIQVFGSVSYITAGRDYIQRPEDATAQHPAIAGIKADTKDNFNYQLQVHIKPCVWENVSVFLKYDYGYDYYNIHFQEKINRIQLGLSGYVN